MLGKRTSEVSIPVPKLSLPAEIIHPVLALHDGRQGRGRRRPHPSAPFAGGQPIQNATKTDKTTLAASAAVRIRHKWRQERLVDARSDVLAGMQREHAGALDISVASGCD